MNKKLYWGTVSLLAFLALSAIGAGYSLISFPDGSDIGINPMELKNSGLTSLTNVGYVVTNLFGFGGLAFLSFSLKRFKTFALSCYLYAGLLFIGTTMALLMGFTHYLIFLFIIMSILIAALNTQIQKQLKALNQW